MYNIITSIEKHHVFDMSINQSVTTTFPEPKWKNKRFKSNFITYCLTLKFATKLTVHRPFVQCQLIVVVIYPNKQINHRP